MSWPASARRTPRLTRRHGAERRLDRLPGGARIWAVDWRRVVMTATVALVPVVAIALLAARLETPGFGADFHGGAWAAGADVLHGRSPYPPANSHHLLLTLHAFVTPPPLALLAVPFSLLPFPIALALWNVMCVAALCLALRVVGVRDVRIYVLALATFPMWDSLQIGQADALFALAAALTWRYRESWPGAVAAGALIAMKLLAWPLVIWFLVTRRVRSAAVTMTSAILILLGSWACLGFKGLAGYPNLLAADARAFENSPLSYSIVHALWLLGLSTRVSEMVAVVICIAIGAAIVGFARGSDEGWFAAALTVGVLSSLILWPHYLVVLFVPIALARRHRLAIWLVAAYSSWLALIAIQFSEGRAIAFPLIISVLVVVATYRRRAQRSAAIRAPVVSGQAGTARPPAAGDDELAARGRWPRPRSHGEVGRRLESPQSSLMKVRRPL